jgi:hypothetical protein
VVALFNDLHADFVLKDHGNPSFFLGARIKKISNANANAIQLTQRKFESDRPRVDMKNGKSSPTPMSTSEKLSTHEGDLLGLEDSTNYRSIVGTLQYSTLTRPGIALLVNKVCKCLHLPITLHWTTINRMLRYGKHTLGLGIIFMCHLLL